MVARRLSHTMVVNAIMTSNKALDTDAWPVICKKTLEYVQRDLKVPFETRNQGLMAKVVPKAVTADKVQRTTAEGLSPSSTTASSKVTIGAVANTEKNATSLPPKKKLKKSGSILTVDGKSVP